MTSFYRTQYEKILSDPDSYFERAKIVNLDIINHECRGNSLKHDKAHYETLFKKEVFKIDDAIDRYNFISAAKRSERADVRFEKDLLKSHFQSVDLKERLKKRVFISVVCRNVKSLQITVNLCIFSS